MPKRIYWVCTIEDCGRKHYAHGWCWSHWHRWRTWGSPFGTRPPREPYETRWMKYVNVESPGCWTWTGARDPNGYGRYAPPGNTAADRRGRTFLAHRAIYEILVGPIPRQLHLDHLCRVPSCVNPDHLEPVTALTNRLRGANTFAIQRNCRLRREAALISQ